MFIGFHLLNKNDLLVIISILHRLQLRFWRFKKHLSDTKSYKQNDPESHKSGARLSRHCGGLEADNIPYTFHCPGAFCVGRKLHSIQRQDYVETCLP